MAEEIVMTFKKDGGVKLEAKGFKGKTCQKALEPFEKAVGKVTKRKQKPEYYQKETNKKKVTG